jgi:hypothetical protein
MWTVITPRKLSTTCVQKRSVVQKLWQTVPVPSIRRDS